MTLQDQLRAIAETAPPMRVDRDPWGPAQRSRRRRRAGSLVAVVAAITAIAGLAVWLPRAAEPPIATADIRYAVPDRIEAVPAHLADRGGDERWSRSQVTSDLAVGTAAAAYVMQEGLPVVIGAVDGAYHLLDLPGFLGNDLFVLHGLNGSEISVALSPDGRRLAYGYADIGPDAASAPIPSGVRVLDLETGDLREVPVPLAEGTQVTRLRFSPGGRWILWTGHSLGSWTAASMGQSRFVAGRIAPGASSSEPVDVLRGGGREVAAIDDGGVVVRVRPTNLLRWDGDTIGRARTDLRSGLDDSASLAPDGSTVGVGDCCAPEARFVDTTAGTITTSSIADVSGTAPLGWLDDALEVLRVQPQLQGDGSLVLVGPDRAARTVGSIDQDVPDLSVAVDLMDGDRPTIARPAPGWPWSSTRIGVTTALTLGGVVVLGALLLTGRRRARPLGRPGEENSQTGKMLDLLGGIFIAAAVTVVWGYGVSRLGLTLSDRGGELYLLGPFVTVVAGIVALTRPRRRRLGTGLLVGVVATIAAAPILLTLAIGS